jgi:hypothetical protein
MIRIFSIVFFISSCISILNSQQAWTRAKGSYYAQIGVSALSYNSLLNKGEENIKLNRDVSDLTIQGYLEYGITNKLTGTLILPFKVTTVSNSTSVPFRDGLLSSFSNITGGLTYNFFKKGGWVASGKAVVGLPTATNFESTGLRTGFDATLITPSALVGYGHGRLFTSGEIGYQFRTNNYSNRYMANFQIGRKFGSTENILAILGLEYMNSEANGTYNDGNSIYTGLYLDRQSYFAPVLKGGYKYNDHWMSWISVGGALGGLNQAVAASPGISVSVSYQL